MDWTTPLKSQQVDFIARLDGDPAKLLHCPTPGMHSEVVAIAHDQLKKIRAWCRKSLVESTLPSVAPSMPIRLMLEEKLPLELAIEAIATVLGDRATKVYPQERQSISRCLNFCIKDITGQPQENFGIKVKVAQGMTQNPQWQITLEEIQQNVAIVCVILPKQIQESETEYQLILAGFLPTTMLNTADLTGNLTGNLACNLACNLTVNLNLSDLLYIGGLVSYLENLKTESTNPPSHQTEWLQPLIGGSNYVYPLAVSADGETIVSSSYDGSIKLWHLSADRDRQLLNFLGGQPWSSYPSAGSGSGQYPNPNSEKNTGDSQPGTAKLIRSLPGHNSGVSALAISPDGQTLASGGYDGTISLWNLVTGEMLRKFSGHSSTVKPITISPDGCFMATGSTDNILKLWDINTGTTIRSFTLSDPPVAIAISPDGQTIACGSTEGIVNLWQISTGELKYQFPGHAGLVRSLSIAPDGQTLASSSTEKTIKLWDMTTGELRQTLTGHTDPMMALTVKPDGQTLELTITQRQQPGWH